jgi:hypothetical protein
MLMILPSRHLLVTALVLSSTLASAQSAERTKPSASIAGKAVASKATPAKVTSERKRYEFTGAATAGTSQTTGATGSSAAQIAPMADKEKSGCHSRASDA